MKELIKTNKNGQWEILSKNSTNDQELGTEGQDKDHEFSPDLSQKDFRKYVEDNADHFPKKGVAEKDLKDYEWSYESKYSLDELKPLKRNWPAWYQGELDEYKHDHGEKKWKEKEDHFEQWVKSPEKHPVILIEGHEGRIHQIDGHHRTAMAFIKKLKTIPAIMGRKK